MKQLNHFHIQFFSEITFNNEHTLPWIKSEVPFLILCQLLHGYTDQLCDETDHLCDDTDQLCV